MKEENDADFIIWKKRNTNTEQVKFIYFTCWKSFDFLSNRPPALGMSGNNHQPHSSHEILLVLLCLTFPIRQFYWPILLGNLLLLRSKRNTKISSSTTTVLFKSQCFVTTMLPINHHGFAKISHMQFQFRFQV